MKPSRMLRQFKRADQGEDMLADRARVLEMFTVAAAVNGIDLETAQQRIGMRCQPQSASAIRAYRRQLAKLDPARLPGAL